MTITPDHAEGKRVHDLDRAHVFHSWSAQGALDPMAVAGAEGSYVWDYDGNRYLDFSSQLVNINIGHQHPKVVAAIQEQAGRLATIAPGTPTTSAARRRSGSRRSPPPGTTRCSSPTAAPTRTRTRSGWRGCTPAGTRSSRSTAATTATPAPRSPRPVTRAAGPTSTRDRPRALLRPVPVPLGVLGDDRGGGVRPRAGPPRAGHHVRGPGDDRGDPARDRSWAPPAS